MDKRYDGLAPLSSDECPNSGEDSDEDVITDYLGSTHPDCNHVATVDEELNSLSLIRATDSDYSKDESSVIVMTGRAGEQHRQEPLVVGSRQLQPGPLVPIISVTPHSPGLVKHYPVLEGNLQQLHEIHESIQRMRDQTLTTLVNNAREHHHDYPQRLSSSCPSLCPIIVTDHNTQNNTDAGSDPELLVNCSANSSPTHYPPLNHHHSQEVDRRRSWTDLEDSRLSHRRSGQDHHLQTQSMRQRSISLSSLDSELELALDTKPHASVAGVGVGVGAGVSVGVGVSGKACRAQASTHSLNEADLIQSDFQKIAAKRERLGENGGLMPGVIGSRLPLQKSISTPSIVTPPGNTHPTETGTRTIPLLTAILHGGSRHERGSESETETEDVMASHGHGLRGDLTREGTPNPQASLDELLADGAVYDDHHSEKTRRKRGSLFFRKKKDKSGKKASQHHQWIAVTAGNHGGVTCDICTKHLANKPALHCEICGMMVHQNQGCKDQVVTECVKAKQQHLGKAASKSTSSASLTATNAKRGSTTFLPPPTSTSGREINNKKTTTGYSPWRRVATKLGVNQTINEEKDGDGGGQQREAPSGWEESEFEDEAHRFSVEDLEGLDPELGLAKDEPDSWSAAVGRNVAPRLVNNCEREVKRQEHIYEFILTEKHHCLVLLAMERIFAEGLRRHFRLGPPDLERMFPRLRDLTDIHLRFLLKLRRRQLSSSVVPTIADILVEQFSGANATRMKSAYGEFCSRHRDAVDAYKYYLRHDPRFARFVRHCQTNPLLKKKGIPECILFVTQRLTKYPLLVEPLIKTGVAPQEGDNLRKALALVKEILGDVDACVADKEREDRKLEIYNRIDAKSFSTHRGAKFKKSDILGGNRSLKFEGTAYLMQGRSKMAPIVVVVLSDVLFFLAETRDQKYAFFAPDNKAGVVSLQKLLVREKAGQQESRGIYLISSNPAEPEMFELKVQKPKDKQIWIQAIRSAVEACPQDVDNDNDNVGDNSDNNEQRDHRSSSISTLAADERQRIAEAKQSHIRTIVGELRKKDAEQALLLEEKMGLQLRLLSAASLWTGNDSDNERGIKCDREVPDYSRLVRGEGGDSAQLWREVVVAVQEATRLASSLSFSTGSATLSRSLSSAGERHSDAYVPPALCVPRRAETFAGFDHNKERLLWRDSATLSAVASPSRISDFLGDEGEGKEDDEIGLEANSGGREQQMAAIRLSHYVYTLLCIISNQMTTIDSLQAQLAACKEGGLGKTSNNRPNSNRQLEELRNLQDRLSREKAAWRSATQQERSQLDEERNELARLREQLGAEQRDVTQQRDQLYRRLEALERQGVSLVAPSPTGSGPIHAIQAADALQPRKTPADSKRIPLNLISATNQQKVQSSIPPIKQQLPLKLASGSNNNNSTRSGTLVSHNSPDRHSRAGSSPAIVTSSSFSSPELGSNHNTSNCNNQSQSWLRVARSPPEQQQQQPQQQQQQQQQQRMEPQPLEEEVIFF